MKYLNLGCGLRFHPDWTNINFTKTGKDVFVYDLNRGIPFPDNSFDVVYHSHILEHFPKSQAMFFVTECFRVLKPQGILRIAVPDLEQIVKTYLLCLEKVEFNSQEWQQNYEWILLEMFDQAVRNVSGGEMAKFIYRQDLINQEFITRRSGIKIPTMSPENLSKETTNIIQKNLIRNIVKHIYRFFKYDDYRRVFFQRLLLNKEEFEALQIGKFRQTGEVHQWMYDYYSLSLLLQKCGFGQIKKQTASESYILNWTSFNLDTESDGSVYKPDSLFIEAIKSNNS
jgi:predicted SAM-dependent methyltransferase